MVLATPPILAEAGYGSVVLTTIVVLGLALGLVVLAAYARKTLFTRDDGSATPGGFSLSDLRRLRDSGEMSVDEYEKARGMIVDAAKRAADRQATVAAGQTVEPKSPEGPPLRS
jgi:hypothetical protein